MDLTDRRPRVWYYRPRAYTAWGYQHGSDEWGRCTMVFGTPLTGHLVIARRRSACLSVDEDARMAYVNINQPTGMLRMEELGHGIVVDIDAQTGHLAGIDIQLPPKENHR